MYGLGLKSRQGCRAFQSGGSTFPQSSGADLLRRTGGPNVHGSTMVNFPGRSDRRRRVLKEEVLSATSSRTALRNETDSGSGQASRYSDAAGVENHPQVTDFVPRRYGTVALLVL